MEGGGELVGFGFGLISMAALSQFLPVRQCTPMVMGLCAPVIWCLFWKLRPAAVWSRLTPVLVGVLFGALWVLCLIQGHRIDGLQRAHAQESAAPEE